MVTQLERPERDEPDRFCASWQAQRETLSSCTTECRARNVVVFLLDAPLSLQEYVTHKKVTFAEISRAVAGLISGRRDVVVFGAHAVNAYAREERMTSDIDVMSTNAAGLAEEIRACLAKEFHISVRVRSMTKRGAGFRVYQLMKPKNRPLVDVRQEDHLPDSVSKRGVRFVEPAALLAMKVISYVARRNQIKGDTDRVDIRRMLEAFPELRKLQGKVTNKLLAEGASSQPLQDPSAVLEAWHGFVNERLDPDDDEY